jgi:hypothetical protein
MKNTEQYIYTLTICRGLLSEFGLWYMLMSIIKPKQCSCDSLGRTTCFLSAEHRDCVQHAGLLTFVVTVIQQLYADAMLILC